LSVTSAQEVLHQFPDGAFFVALAPLEDPSLIALTIVQTLEFTEAEFKSPLERLRDGISGKQMLLVLDNLEHIIDGAASLVSDLLSICLRLKILTTSREALRVPGEWLYPVPPLSVPERTELQSKAVEEIAQYSALTLFAERARAIRPDFTLNIDNIQAVANICSQLDGLPLAIELISARIRLMSPQTLLAKLTDQFVLSADGMRTVSARQKTLHNAIRWSYNLLSSEEQILFVRLSVFSGSFTIDAVEAIFSRTVINKSVSDHITLLLDKSLLQRELDSDAEPRFSLLVTLHQFALVHLRQMGEETQVRNWHLAYFLDLAEKADMEIHGSAQVAWLDKIESEYDNFRAALEWCLSQKYTETAIRLLSALEWSWRVRGHHHEIQIWFNSIHSLADSAEYPAIYAKLLVRVGRTCWLLGAYQDAHIYLEESQAICLKLGNESEQVLAETLDILGMVEGNTGNEKKSVALHQQGLELYRKWGNKRGMAESMFHLGIPTVERFDVELSLSLLEQSLILFQGLGDLWGIARVSQGLGELYLAQQNYKKAKVCFDKHLSIDEKLRFRQGHLMALISLGDFHRYQGDYRSAETYYNKSLAMAREYGLDWIGYSYYSLGMLALHQNDYVSAMKRFSQLFEIDRKRNENSSTCELLFNSAAIAGGTNRPERSAKLYGAAQALIDISKYRVPAFDRKEFDRHIQIARSQVGEATFEALAAEGHAMTMEQAVAYALDN
jgi:predicted ATPase/Tfp pilus assembly protein PilF